MRHGGPAPPAYDLWLRLKNALSASPKVDFLEGKPGRVQHIVEPKHLWDRLVTLSGDLLRDYRAIQPYIRETIRPGKPTLDPHAAQATLGPVLEFVGNVKGEQVVVRVVEIARGIYRISNAFVKRPEWR